MAMSLVSRADWGARAYRTPSGATLYSVPRLGVKVHYLGTAYSDRPHEQCAAYVRSLQASHMDGNGWSDIGYSFVVCTHGSVFEGRGLRRRNSANGSTSLNERHYAVCALVGNSGHTRPTEAQLHGVRDAIEYCRAQGPAGSEIRGHRDGYATDCPGGPLYAWVQAGAPRPAAPIPAPRPEPPAPFPEPPAVEEDMIVLEGELPVGYDTLASRVVAVPTVPPGKTAFVNVACGYAPSGAGAVAARVDAFVNGSWVFLGEGITTRDTDNAFWPVPAGARKLHLKRVAPGDVIPELADEVAALGDAFSPNVAASWLIEVV